jgi:hypothetical protein
MLGLDNDFLYWVIGAFMGLYRSFMEVLYLGIGIMVLLKHTIISFVFCLYLVTLEHFVVVGIGCNRHLRLEFVLHRL